MVTAKLYIEGGGDKRSHRAKAVVLRFRQGWKTFFDRAGLGDLPASKPPVHTPGRC